MHSPPRIRPKEYVQTLRPALHKADPGAQSAGPAQKTGPETAGPVRAARAPGCGEKSTKKGGPARRPALPL